MSVSHEEILAAMDKYLADGATREQAFMLAIMIDIGLPASEFDHGAYGHSVLEDYCERAA